MKLRKEQAALLRKAGLDPDEFTRDFIALLRQPNQASNHPALCRLTRSLFEDPDDRDLDDA